MERAEEIRPLRADETALPAVVVSGDDDDRHLGAERPPHVADEGLEALDGVDDLHALPVSGP